MPTSTANINWIRPSGSTGTLIEYKVSTDAIWIQPTSPDNPTLATTYPLTIEDNVRYDVRLTNFGATCGPRSITFTILASVDNCCPSGYTLSMDGTFCQQVNTTAATPPSNPQNTVSKTFNTYSTWGALIYNLGFNVNGTGSFTQIPYTNSFWVNGAGYPTNTASIISGPLNRSGLWTSACSSGQIIGFTQCITLASDGVYYIGIGVDDFGTINVDGNTIVQMDPSAMNAFLVANGYPLAFGFGGEITFRFWHIYPIALSAGDHVLEVIGNNGTCPAAVGTEIYNATSSDLQSATSYVDLGSKLIFSTKDIIGQPVQVGSGGFGYSCPSGYSLVLCDGPAFCTQTLTTGLIPCTTTSTTTTTTTSTSTSTSTTTSTTTSTSTSTTTSTTSTTTTTTTTA